MSTPRNRQPSGTPTGGQFAASSKPASGLDLTGPVTREPTDDDIDYFYRDGDASACFADTVAARTGWPVVVASDGPDGVAGWAHAGVRTPDGFIIDVEGARTEEDWIDNWEVVVDMWGSDSDDYDGELAGVYPATDHGWTADGFFVPHSEDDQQRADEIVDAVLAKAHDTMSVDGDPVTGMAPGLRESVSATVGTDDPV